MAFHSNGIPQLSAIMMVANAAREYGFSIIADEGVFCVSQGVRSAMSTISFNSSWQSLSSVNNLPERACWAVLKL